MPILKSIDYFKQRYMALPLINSCYLIKMCSGENKKSNDDSLWPRISTIRRCYIKSEFWI